MMDQRQRCLLDDALGLLLLVRHEALKQLLRLLGVSCLVRHLHLQAQHLLLAHVLGLVAVGLQLLVRLLQPLLGQLLPLLLALLAQGLLIRQRARLLLLLRLGHALGRRLGRLLPLVQLQVVVLAVRHGARVVVLDVVLEQLLLLGALQRLHVHLLHLQRPQRELGPLGRRVRLAYDTKLAKVVRVGECLGCCLVLALVLLPLLLVPGVLLVLLGPFPFLL
mmetsp:Transcript_19084/g.48490  ORF Transcript_19084/g.48490 Transcript_19084/m.48490 type:complete len:221 (+) Transcript_19084:319-981(+)